VPSGIHKGKDGWVMIKCVEQESGWVTLTRAMGREDLGTDPRYNTFERRRERKDEVYAIIDDWVQSFASVDDVEALLVEAGVPCARVNDVEHAINHPQIRARRMLVDRRHPTLGPMLIMNSGLNFSATSAEVHGEAAFLGQHNREVLSGLLGVAESEIDRLTGLGVLYEDPRLGPRGGIR
jgi:crotonobetainyl-CoA:carnitine CoA-transferase CaiB-like acyl-CoA transferase